MTLTPTIRPLHPVLGAEATGFDLARDLDAPALRLLRAAITRHLVVVLPGQAMDLMEQVAFTAQLGALARHPVDGLRLDAAPDVLLERPETETREAEWHAHLTWAAEPNRYSALAPEGTGGATDFASLEAAHDRLDPWLREHVQYLGVKHDHARRRAAGLAPAVHPLVRVDPETGRRALMLDAGTAQRVLSLPEAEGAALLRRLQAIATDPAITFRHHWQAGDLVVWDNRAVLHRFAEAPRGALRRTMVRGAPPQGPAAFAMPWVSAG